MVDFQSRDTRRGPTDGEDDETDGGETGDDEESAAAETDAEAVTSEPNEAAGNDDVASEKDSDAPTAPDDTAGASGGSVSEAESDSSVAERIDEAATQSTDSESAGETQDAEGTDTATEGHEEEPHSETQAAGQPADTPQAVVPTADETPAQTATQADAAREQQVAVAVVTVGTATEEGDPTGEAVETALEATGQTVTARERLRGDYDGIQGAVDRLVGRDDVEVVVTAGGLGVAPTEQTLEAVHPLFEKALPGFEEVYRSLLFEQQGTGVIAVRTTAGIADETPVFCLPADPAAARVAIDEIIAAEAPALVAELS